MRALLAAAALLGAASAAQATDTQSGRTTAPAITIDGDATRRGVFEFAGDVEWYRVRLERGRHYAFGVDPGELGGEVHIALYDRDGRRLAGPAAAFGEGSGGFSLTARYEGRYFLALTAYRPNEKPPIAYSFRAAPDCAPGVRTQCRLKEDAARSGFLTWADDADGYAVQLTAGVRYGVRASFPNKTMFLELIDGQRTRLASLAVGSGAGDTLWFTPRRTATYYVVAQPDDVDFLGKYTLTLIRP